VIEEYLLAEVYETIRKTDQSKFDRAATNASELLRRGFVPQASQLERQTRPILDDLEWDVKLYSALNAAVHDAACAAWSARGSIFGTSSRSTIRAARRGGRRTRAASG
jgi:hypothetical protein